MGALEALCRRWGVRRLALYGSALRDDFGPESDIDVLVELAADSPALGLTFFTLKFELEDLFGREVDLATPGSIYEPFRERIFSTSRDVYVAA